MTGESPALDQHVLAALHYDEAARRRKTREYETATRHVCLAQEHLLRARVIILRERQKAVIKLLAPPFALKPTGSQDSPW